MRTQLSPENPFGHTRYGFAWEQVPAGSAAHLDFGCYDGRFLQSLTGKGVGRLAGVDASREAVALAHAQSPQLEVQHLGAAATTPFPDATFSSASLMDVLEHVYDQAGLLRELHRVLQPGGRLIVTVPGQHVFSFLDSGNLKFRFPRLHRWWYCRRHGREAYEQRYVCNPDGLVGDVSAQKRWHEHFTQRHLAELLHAAGFRVLAFDGAGLLARVLFPFLMLTRRLRPLHHALDALARHDARHFASKDLFCLAEKL